MVQSGIGQNSQSVRGGALETTASLLAQVRSGQEGARDQLVRRYLPALRRWARGRLPSRARDLLDTDDLVQITLLRALDRVEGFEPRRDGAFLAYLTRTLMNQLRNEIRRTNRRPGREDLTEEMATADPSPLEEAIGREAVASYERALATLTEEQREAIVMRIELAFTHREVAEALGCPSENAARMMVTRALMRLAEAMDEQRG